MQFPLRNKIADFITLDTTLKSPMILNNVQMIIL